MNEREAIEFILNELKEQRRADFEMYFEMRKTTTETYERFLNRLREIDEMARERKRTEVPVIHTKPIITTRPVVKDLPISKAHHMTVAEVRDERVEKEEEEKEEPKRYIDSVTVTEAIEQYLKRANRWVDMSDIKKNVEKELNHEWANFSTNMRRALDVSPHIEVHKITERKFLYHYKEV